MTQPIFPKFKKLTIRDKSKLRHYLAKYDSYSDFNFTSIYVWGDDQAEYCWLDSNLVISLPDYLTQQTVISIIGSNNINDAVEKVTKYAKTKGINQLSLVPEIVANNLDESKFKVIEDRNNYDYIYSINSILNLRGNRFEHKRYHIRKILDRDAKSVEVRLYKRPSPTQKKYIIDIFEAWAKSQSHNKDEVEMSGKPS